MFYEHIVYPVGRTINTLRQFFRIYSFALAMIIIGFYIGNIRIFFCSSALVEWQYREVLFVNGRLFCVWKNRFYEGFISSLERFECSIVIEYVG